MSIHFHSHSHLRFFFFLVFAFVLSIYILDMLLLGLFLESKFTYNYLFVFLISFRLCSLVSFFFFFDTFTCSFIAHLSGLSFSFTCNYCFHSTSISMPTVQYIFQCFVLLVFYFHLTFFVAFSFAEWGKKNEARKVIVTSGALKTFSWNIPHWSTVMYRIQGLPTASSVNTSKVLLVGGSRLLRIVSA